MSAYPSMSMRQVPKTQLHFLPTRSAAGPATRLPASMPKEAMLTMSGMSDSWMKKGSERSEAMGIQENSGSSSSILLVLLLLLLLLSSDLLLAYNKWYFCEIYTCI